MYYTNYSTSVGLVLKMVQTKIYSHPWSEVTWLFINLAIAVQQEVITCYKFSHSVITAFTCEVQPFSKCFKTLRLCCNCFHEAGFIGFKMCPII